MVLCQKAFIFGSLTTMLTQNTSPYLMRMRSGVGGGGGGGLTVVRTDVQLCSAIRINLRYKSKDTEK